MSKISPVINVRDVPDQGEPSTPWGGPYRPLTPLLDQLGGRLGVNLSRLAKGHIGCPFHYHLREDEVFYVISGRGVLRYGDELYDLEPGDCVSCPAGTKLAHQIANPYDEDLVYLGIGLNDPHEVCVYPDSGKVMVRGLRRVGYLEEAPYMAGEPEQPKILAMAAERLARQQG